MTACRRRSRVAGREVVWERRPNKRVFAITNAGRATLREFIAASSTLRDELLVKVHAAEAGDLEALASELDERAVQARAKAKLIDGLLSLLRGEQTEQEFLATSPRIRPYLTGLHGRAFETENREWGVRTAAPHASPNLRSGGRRTAALGSASTSVASRPRVAGSRSCAWG